VKPVDKGPNVIGINDYRSAKPDLIDRIGAFCSYCECAASPQNLQVEHIYPQAATAHPRRIRNWRNFLLSCNSCNSSKRASLGNGKQRGLLKRMLWPHIDNTFRAYIYRKDGRVDLSDDLPDHLRPKAEALRDMVGLLRSPDAAVSYEDWGIAYGGVTKRSEAWGIGERALAAYTENPSRKQLDTLLDLFQKHGYFSIWMTVFASHSEVRSELIRVSKAAQMCFDASTKPVTRARF
jgi:uncharacterized protein (TIGR02646 family)